MKLIFALYCLCIISSQANACLSASQNRLFPLGKTSRGLAFVETRLIRTEYPQEDDSFLLMEPAWFGYSYYKIYDKNHTVIYSIAIDTIALFREEHYDSIIGLTVKKGMLLAQQEPGFLLAKPLSITFCNYRDSCDKTTLIIDILKNQIEILLDNDKNTYPIKPLFDITSIASNLLSSYQGGKSEKILVKEFANRLGINSIRKYELGTEQLTIIHLGVGNNLFSTDEENDPIKLQDEVLKHEVFQEPVLHHGKGFDFFIWD